MKYFYKILLWIIIAILLGCSQQNSGQEFVQNYINEKQKEIGIQCPDLYQNARMYLNTKVDSFINSCRRGEDCVSIYRESMYADISEFNKKLMVCWLCKSNADRVGIDMEGYYEEIRHLFDGPYLK